MKLPLRPRAALQSFSIRREPYYRQGNNFSTSSFSFTPRNDDIDEMFSKPSWSVRSLLPEAAEIANAEKEVSPEQLSHLLRLSALPQPTDETEQKDLLNTLQSQIHFVKEIQKVDTAGVIPLVALRDESPAALAENTIDLEDLKDAFAQEKRIGRNGRIKRQRTERGLKSASETWNPLEMASKTAGRYFVVQKAKKDPEAPHD